MRPAGFKTRVLERYASLSAMEKDTTASRKMVCINILLDETDYCDRSTAFMLNPGFAKECKPSWKLGLDFDTIIYDI